jgi:hypothetical protein
MTNHSNFEVVDSDDQQLMTVGNAREMAGVSAQKNSFVNEMRTFPVYDIIMHINDGSSIPVPGQVSCETNKLF